jgi:hypothetical protein
LGFPTDDTPNHDPADDHVLKWRSGPVTGVTQLDQVAGGLVNSNPNWDPYREIVNSNIFAKPGISGGPLMAKDANGRPEVVALIDFTKYLTNRNNQPLRNNDGTIVYTKYAGATPIEDAKAFLRTIPYQGAQARPYYDTAPTYPAPKPAPPVAWTQPRPELAPPVVAPAKPQVKSPDEFKNLLDQYLYGGLR